MVFDIDLKSESTLDRMESSFGNMHIKSGKDHSTPQEVIEVKNSLTTPINVTKKKQSWHGPFSDGGAGGSGNAN